MTGDDELVEMMAIARHEHRRRLSPLVVSFGWYDLDPADQAAMIAEDRAALAVAEPVIRENAARVVLNWSLPTIQTPSMWLIDKHGIAAAIRTGATP